MREVIFYLAMIIEIAYVFMSQVPKKLENNNSDNNKLYRWLSIVSRFSTYNSI